MNREQLRKAGYRIRFNGYGWGVEHTPPLEATGLTGDSFLQGNEESIPITRVVAMYMYSEVEAVEKAIIDFVMRRVS